MAELALEPVSELCVVSLPPRTTASSPSGDSTSSSHPKELVRKEK